jgi:hypothetical protein
MDGMTNLPTPDEDGVVTDVGPEISAEVAVQVERVETLLAAVRDIVSSLGATSAQLEREVAQALRTTPALPEPPSPAARHGASASSHAALEAQRAALLEAVEHRAVIEQAKGMLMLKHRCEADAAFELLVEISRRERRKVRDIAGDLVRAGSRPARAPVVDLTDGGQRPARAARG